MAQRYINLDKAQNKKDVAYKKYEEALIKQQKWEVELNLIAAHMWTCQNWRPYYIVVITVIVWDIHWLILQKLAEYYLRSVWR